MRDAYIVSSVRTPGCKNRRGGFRETRPENLIAHALKSCAERVGVDPINIDDCMIGCSFPEAEQGMNLGRMAARMAGFPNEVCGGTINRFCSSGLEAIAISTMRVAVGWSEMTMGGGLESMTYVPMASNTPRPHPVFSKTNPEAYISMGMTAENIAAWYNISRQEMDEFAVNSHAKAAEAQAKGYFTEIVPTPATYYVRQADGTYKVETKMLTEDDGVRAGTTVEGISRLNSPFKIGGTVTAATSSQTTDGAAATLIASKEACDRLGLKPIAKLIGYAVAGCRSEEMGVGPKYAIPKVLKQLGMTVDQIDLWEINEAFASQAIYSLKEVGLWDKYMDRVNICGGAIALGHPLGCSGAKLTATLLAQLQRTGGKYGVVSMCIGGGMGAAGVFEMV